MIFVFKGDLRGIPDVDCEKEFYPVAWVLSDNSRPEQCDEIMEEIKRFRVSGVEWEMSYDKSVLCLSEKGVTCIDAFNESAESMLSFDRFDSLVKKWKAFLVNPKQPLQVNI